MIKKNRTLLALALITGVFIFLLSGCSALSNIALPSPPSFPTETVRPTKTPKPSVSLSPSPSPTLPPSPSASAELASEVTAEPSASVEPTATVSASAPTLASAEATSAPTPAAVTYTPPTITIEGQTLPGDMTRGNVCGLFGAIRSDCGNITTVVGSLYHSTGEVEQQFEYYPNTSYFSLGGTVNNDLRFGLLTPDTYIYQIVAYAENGTASSEAILISHAFTVTSQSVSVSGGSSGAYTAKTTSDTDNAAQIWNFFINEFNNPYAAAAILGNIYTESSCDPNRVEGDLSGTFSASYTAQVDSGSISRKSFTSYVPGDKYGRGYGLCQWTSSDRKGNLYDLAAGLGTSVADLNTQCAFILFELQTEYPALLEYLKTADDAEAAAFEFCTVFEQAAVHGGRTTFAKDYLDKYAA